MNNNSLKQKWFSVMLVTALFSMLMLGSVPAFADVITPVEAPAEVGQEVETVIPDSDTVPEEETGAEPEAQTEFVPEYDVETYDDSVVLYQTYSESEPQKEQTIGDKLDAKFYDFDVAVYKVFGKIQNKVTLVISKLFTNIAHII